MARVSQIRLIEARWGMPFWDLMRDFAAQGLTRMDTARAMGFANPKTIHTLLRRAPLDPFPIRHGVPTQYTLDTGETFRAACIRMAPTHTITEAALILGYTACGSLRHAMRVRGIEVQFRTRPPRRRPPGKPRVSDTEVLRYAQLRIEGTVDTDAIATVGRSKTALRRHLQAKFPKLWDDILQISAKHHRTRNATRSRAGYKRYLDSQP